MQHLTLASIVLFLYSVAAQGTEKNVGPCMKEKTTAGAPIPGKYIPQCLDSGYYKPIQCHASTGFCWCANPDDGKKVESAGQFRNREVIRCPMCHIKRAEALHPHSLLGRYVPQCDGNGLFTPTQHHSGIGHSWCVDPQTGAEIEGTRKRAGEQSAECDVAAMAGPMHKLELILKPQGPCQSKQQRQGKLGAFQPLCTENGYFRTEQRHSSTGSTWCANPMTGTEIQGTRRSPTETKVACGACFKELEVQLAPNMPTDAHMPQCNEETGHYLPVQFREGFKYCVNPTTGALTGKIYHVADNRSLQCYKN